MALTTATNGAYMAQNDALSDCLYAIEERIDMAFARYGEFASTHEALGVAIEEWHELIDAIRANDLSMVQNECMDLAAVCLRLATSLSNSSQTQNRSTK
jgi:NTP pyrophosphatase (non-canonical NTP hydrolase)